MLRRENQSLKKTEEEGIKLGNLFKASTAETHELTQKIIRLENLEKEKERENQELHEDNYDLSQTVQQLKEEMEKIEQEMENTETECKNYKINNKMRV